MAIPNSRNESRRVDKRLAAAVHRDGVGNPHQRHALDLDVGLAGPDRKRLQLQCLRVKPLAKIVRLLLEGGFQLAELAPQVV